MATQTLVPDAVLASSSVVSATTAQLAAQDTSWVVASSNNTNTSVRVSMPTPTASPTTGANLQTVTVQTRKNTTNSGSPSYSISVGFNGTTVLTSGTFTVTSTAGQLNSFTFDFAALISAGAAANGSDFEVTVNTVSVGGSPSARNSVDIGYVAWVADYALDTTAPTITTGSSAFTYTGETLAVSLTANESVSWTISGGTNSALFEISGTTLRWLGNGTQAAGNYSVNVRATDAATNFSEKTITVTVHAQPSLTGTFPDGDIDVPYSHTPTRTGGVGPYSFSVVSGTLPYGLTLNASTGEISGTPITEPLDEIPDQFTFTDLTNVTGGSLSTSNEITISGLSAGASVEARISGSITAQMQKNGGAWGAGPMTAQNGDKFRVRHENPFTSLSNSNTTLFVGPAGSAVFDTFTSRTA